MSASVPRRSSCHLSCPPWNHWFHGIEDSYFLLRKPEEDIVTITEAVIDSHLQAV